jgi:hypothetical protein
MANGMASSHEVPSDVEGNGMASDGSRGSARAFPTRPEGDFTALVTNPPTSDNGVTSTELTRETCDCGHLWAHHFEDESRYSLRVRCSMCLCMPGFIVVPSEPPAASVDEVLISSLGHHGVSASPSTGDQQ